MMTFQQATRLGLSVVLLLVLVGMIGCGGGPDTPATVKVTGTVTYNGDPLDGASVAFIPENGRPASGTTDASGKFALSTFKSGDGAVLGKHTVSISEAAEEPSEEGQEDYSLPDENAAGRFPAKYANPATSSFSAEVSNDKHDFTFEMTDE